MNTEKEPVSNGSTKNNNQEVRDYNDLERLRTVLFGTQLKEFSQRTIRFEEKLTQQLESQKLEFQTRLDSLEKFVKSEIQTVQDNIADGLKNHVTRFKGLENEIKRISKAFVNEIKQTKLQFSKSEHQLHELIHDNSKIVTDEIAKTYKEIMLELTNESHILHSSKIDRSELASILGEWAIRLNSGETVDLKHEHQA